MQARVTILENDHYEVSSLIEELRRRRLKLAPVDKYEHEFNGILIAAGTNEKRYIHAACWFSSNRMASIKRPFYRAERVLVVSMNEDTQVGI